MSRYTDLTNKRFGRLFVVALDHITESDKRVFWRCWCDCGAEKSVRGDMLRSGDVQSCGCLGKERRAAATVLATLKHGMTRGKRGEKRAIPPEYRAWSNMKNRCLNQKSKRYADWGGRGIKVCDRWAQSFEAFYADMGRRPGPKYSLDRIDVNGNYEPSNCRWADAATQRRNRRDSAGVET